MQKSQSAKGPTQCKSGPGNNMVCRLNYLSEVESKTQGSRPRPRTALPRTDPLEAKDRNARGQGQGPRTETEVFSEKNQRYDPKSNKYCCKLGFGTRATVWQCRMQWCRSLLSIGEANLQFYPNFALFSTLGGMNLDHDFVQVWKFSEDQKKKKQTEHFFSQIQVKTIKKGLHQK